MRAIKVIATLIALTIYGCSAVHVPVTPNFISSEEYCKGNIRGTMGFSGPALNLVYRPTKFVALHLNGQSSFIPTSYRNSHTYADAGVTLCIPKPRSTYGLTLNYGLGNFDWSNSFAGSGSSFTGAEGRYDKTSFQIYYLAYSDSSKNTWGVAGTYGLFNTSYSYHSSWKFSGHTRYNFSSGLFGYYNRKLNDNCSFCLIAGIQYDDANYMIVSVPVRIGFEYRFKRK